jgi:hypothetical protein
METSLAKIDRKFVSLVRSYFAGFPDMTIEAHDGIEMADDKPTRITADLLKDRLLNLYKDYFGPRDQLAFLTREDVEPVGRAQLTTEAFFNFLIDDWKDGAITQFNLDEQGQRDLSFIAEGLRSKLYTLFDKIESEGAHKDVLGKEARPFGKMLH